MLDSYGRKNFELSSKPAHTQEYPDGSSPFWREEKNKTVHILPELKITQRDCEELKKLFELKLRDEETSKNKDYASFHCESNSGWESLPEVKPESNI